jgi:hypothetical protein
MLDSKMYLNLFHGRDSKNQDMEGWGDQGPIVPIDGFGFTYSTLTVYDVDGTDSELVQDEDLIFYDGKWYGDFSILTPGELTTTDEDRLITFAEFDAKNKAGAIVNLTK